MLLQRNIYVNANSSASRSTKLNSKIFFPIHIYIFFSHYPLGSGKRKFRNGLGGLLLCCAQEFIGAFARQLWHPAAIY